MATERLRPGSVADARNRRIIATRYLEIAELAAAEEGPGANNVVVGIAVLAGIAASDAICLAAIGARYAGEDHAEAARVLARTDKRLGQELSKLVRLKPGVPQFGRSRGGKTPGSVHFSTSPCPVPAR